MIFSEFLSNCCSGNSSMDGMLLRYSVRAIGCIDITILAFGIVKLWPTSASEPIVLVTCILICTVGLAVPLLLLDSTKVQMTDRGRKAASRMWIVTNLIVIVYSFIVTPFLPTSAGPFLILRVVFLCIVVKFVYFHHHSYLQHPNELEQQQTNRGECRVPESSRFRLLVTTVPARRSPSVLPVQENVTNLTTTNDTQALLHPHYNPLGSLTLSRSLSDSSLPPSYSSMDLQATILARKAETPPPPYSDAYGKFWP